LAPGSIEAAAKAVTRALKRRDARLAEAICLAIAILATIATYFRLLDGETLSWAVRVSPDGYALTLAGWWCVVVSNPLFWFLVMRWLWRLFVWAKLLHDLAALELRLVATHPDGQGGSRFHRSVSQCLHHVRLRIELRAGCRSCPGPHSR